MKLLFAVAELIHAERLQIQRLLAIDEAPPQRPQCKVEDEKEDADKLGHKRARQRNSETGRATSDICYSALNVNHGGHHWRAPLRAPVGSGTSVTRSRGTTTGQTPWNSIRKHEN